MSRYPQKKYALYLLLIIFAMGIIYYFQLENEHELKTWIKSFIRAIT